jgi:hypothetical protein
MPTKRRVLIFFLVLAVMLLVRYAASEESRMQWRGPTGEDSAAIEHAVYVLMGGGIVFGVLVSGGRALANKRRMNREGYFTGDLTMMSLKDQDSPDRKE